MRCSWMPSGFTRRDVVLVIAGSAAWLSCGGSDGDSSPSDTGTSLPPRDDSADTAKPALCEPPLTPAPGWTALSSSDSAAVAEVGSYTYVDIGSAKLIVARATADCTIAVSRICTHQGCSIQYQNEYRRFKCPCHGAVYAEDGSKVTGPQPTGVAAYDCGIGKDGLVYVDVG
jgi:cytochrome b6-f complex iron-sulfur subunit